MRDPAVVAAVMWAVESTLWIVDVYVDFLPDSSIRIINKVARRYAADSLEFHWRTLVSFALELYLSST